MRVKNWGDFQHYKSGKRNPQWIKLYRSILDDIEWHRLDGEASKFLVMLWLLASEDDGEIPSVTEIAFRFRISEKQVKTTISKLDHWLEQSASKPLADGYQSACLEEEEEREEEKEKEQEIDKRRKRRTTIPLDFELTEAMREYALARLPDMDTAGTFAAFKDFHTNKGTLGLDWEAGWRTWVTNAEKFGYVRAKRREQGISPKSRKVSPFEVYDRQPDRPGSVHRGMVAGTAADGGGDDAPQQAAKCGVG